MELNDFLKCKKVRCVKAYGDCLTVGKEYGVIGIRMEVKVKDNEGDNYYWESDHFEPVLDSAENTLQDMKLTPEFEAVEPKFKVGDPVYWGLKSRIFKVFRLMTANVLEVELDDVVTAVHKDELCPATLENYGKLCSLFERIDFEAPPKELTGSDLARAMLDKGWKYVPCYISDSSDTHALERQTRTIVAITGMHKDHPSFFIYGSGKSFIPYAVPFDPKTSEPLTESVLDE